MSSDATSPAASDRASPWKRVEEDGRGSDDHRQRGEEHGSEADGASLDHGLVDGHPLADPVLGEVDEDDRVAHHDPAPAMKPMREVAVKNAPIAACAGKMPTSEKGMGAMTTRGVEKERNHPTSIT